MSSRVRYLHCFSFLFNYASWSEALLTGTLMLFIPVVGPLIIHGWGVAVMHRRIRGEEGLPNFFDMGELIVAGLKPFLVSMAVGVPLSLVAIAVGVFAALGAEQMWEPLLTWADAEAWHQIAILLAGLALLAIVFTVLLGVATWLQVMRLRVEVTGRFGSAFELAGVWSMFRALGGRLALGTLILGAVGPVVYTLGVMLLLIGSYPATTLVSLSWSELRTQLYRAWLAEGHAPLADTSFLDGQTLMLGPEV